MTVTELALLRLLPPTTVSTPSLMATLAKGKTAMQNFTGRRFYYLQQVEDPALIYVFGEWESLDQHMNGFVASSENKELLDVLKGQMAIEWVVHLDVEHKDLPSAEEISDGTKVYSIGRHFVKPVQKSDFTETFQENKHNLQGYVTQGKIGGGWRVDKDGDKEEWVLFCPWKNVDEHLGFANNEGFAKYAKIRDHTDGVDIKHAMVIKEF